MYNWLKKIFCKHHYGIPVRLGGFIKGQSRIRYKCVKCGHVKYVKVS